MSTYVTKDDSIIKSLIAEYFKHVYKTTGTDFEKSKSYISPAYCSFDWGDFRRLKTFSRRKKYRVVDVVPVHHDRITPCSFGVPDIKYKRLIYDKRQGVWRVEMSDNTVLYYTAYQKGLRGEVIRLCVTEEDVWKKFLVLYNKYNEVNQRKIALPEPGVYNVVSTNVGLSYEKKADYPTSQVIHPSVSMLNSDISYFYDHVHLFTRHKQRGVRKILIVGRPGTGKTSVGYRLADTFKDKMPIVFTTDFGTLYQHLEVCAKFDSPTLAFVNDVEGKLRDSSGSSASEILNFMDGTLLPDVKKGAYCIFTTNFPEKIESRYIRPGRIDKIIPWGPLEGTYAVQCAEFYLHESFRTIDNRLREGFLTVFDGMTGAEIRSLSQMCEIRACQEQRDVTIDFIKELKNEFVNVQKILEGVSKPSSSGGYI